MKASAYSWGGDGEAAPARRFGRRESVELKASPEMHMLTTRQTGLLVAATGFVVVLVGLLMASGWLSWFGRLPGDVRIERENVRVYIPITSMLLLSAALSAILWIVRKLS